MGCTLFIKISVLLHPVLHSILENLSGMCYSFLQIAVEGPDKSIYLAENMRKVVLLAPSDAAVYLLPHGLVVSCPHYFFPVLVCYLSPFVFLLFLSLLDLLFYACSSFEK